MNYTNYRTELAFALRGPVALFPDAISPLKHAKYLHGAGHFEAAKLYAVAHREWPKFAAWLYPSPSVKPSKRPSVRRQDLRQGELNLGSQSAAQPTDLTNIQTPAL